MSMIDDSLQLHFKDMAEIVGGNGFSVVRMTDASERRALCIICDQAMTGQLAIRSKNVPGRQIMLPEVLFDMLLDENSIDDFYIQAFGIYQGQYQVVLYNRRLDSHKFIRISDAILLHVMAGVPFYILRSLMAMQSTRFSPDNPAISIPINTLDTESLNRELEHAVENEDYRLAAILRDEILKRKNS